VVDGRFEDQVQAAVSRTAAVFGGIDILVNNASVISLTGTLETPAKRFDLMMDVNVRGTFVCSQACIPWLKRADSPHILILSPPIGLVPKWLGRHPAYTMSKYAMSLLSLGMAEELRKDGIAVNSLWPRTFIATAALVMVEPGLQRTARMPQVMADAAYEILRSDSRATTGNLFIDEQVLKAAGITDFRAYATTPGAEPRIDLFVDEDPVGISGSERHP